MIPDVPPFNNYSGNNFVTRFDYDLSIDNETQLVVLHTDSSEIQRELKLNIDYSIHGVGDPDGGYIIFPLASSSYGLLQADEVISLYLSLPQEQQTPFGTSDKLDMNILEKTFDYVVKLIKIISRQVERSVKIQEGSKISPAELIESLKTSEVNAFKSALNAGLSEQNAKKSSNIATQKADEVLQTYTAAMADITNTAQEALDDMETARQAGVNSIQDTETSALENISNIGQENINNIQSLGTGTLENINSSREGALSDIETSRTAALDEINQDFTTAKDELLATKTSIIDDLINNAAGEALAAVENVKDTAIDTINSSVASAQDELDILIANAEQAADTHISNVQNTVNIIVSNAQNAVSESVQAVTDIQSAVENKADEATASAELARKYATNPEDEPVNNNEYSAMHWALKAENAASSVLNPLDKDLNQLSETGENKIKEIAGSVVPDVDFSFVSDKDLSNLTETGENKIKDIIASVGSEKVDFLFTVNRGAHPILNVIDNTYASGAFELASDNIELECTNISGAKLNISASNISPTFDYITSAAPTYVRTYINANPFCDRVMLCLQLVGNTYSLFLCGMIFSDTDPGNPWQGVTNRTDIPGPYWVTPEGGVKQYSYSGWTTVTNMYRNIIPIGYLTLSDDDTHFKYVEFENNVNWFNVPEPSHYLKADLSNIEEPGEQKLIDIAQQISLKAFDLDYDRAKPFSHNTEYTADEGGVIIASTLSKYAGEAVDYLLINGFIVDVSIYSYQGYRSGLQGRVSKGDVYKVVKNSAETGWSYNFIPYKKYDYHIY